VDRQHGIAKKDLAIISDLIHINASLATFKNIIRNNYNREVDERLERETSVLLGSRANYIELNTPELRNRHAYYRAIGCLDYKLPGIIKHIAMTTRKKIKEYKRAEKPYI
jgi:hypothetical protein